MMLVGFILGLVFCLLLRIFWSTPERAQLVVLQILRARGPLRGLEIADASRGRIRRAAVYVLLNNLEEIGLVHRTPMTGGQHIYQLSWRVHGG